LASIPAGTPERLVKAHSFYHGDLFLAQGKLYLVIGTAADGSRLAKPWAETENQIVALDPHSRLARHYPVVELGEPLPLYLKRNDLLDYDEQPMHFRFLSEPLAFRAVCLDQSLTYRAVLFTQMDDSSTYILTDGNQPYRYYSYPLGAVDDDRAGRPAQPAALDYREGPPYWRFAL
jgi:hypothetical protein